MVVLININHTEATWPKDRRPILIAANNKIYPYHPFPMLTSLCCIYGILCRSLTIT